ncbi:HNH endonuclease [Cellulomonas sp. DKR-3]|uniref:HNH endonuclease n=1 Tax=Cellulomonas fulva TaxID=2835530 RepID=A0ABS5U248_9CELL|nr:HNH endonuclease [Cellulomonas fulva]MBT0995477.1 HNH endonuclease [Cellulomonas fulva]
MTIQIDGKAYLSTAELALRHGVTSHTVHLWRSNGRAPEGRKLRGRTWYEMDDVLTWEAGQDTARAKTPCRIPRCPRPATAGRDHLCAGHAQMVRAGRTDLGGPPPRRPRAKTLSDLLDAMTVRDEDGHRLWTGHLSGDGYAKVARAGVTRYVHRVVWEDAYGPIDETQDLTVDHRCRVRRCCEISHLRLISRAENIQAGFEARLREQEAYSQGALTLDVDLETRRRHVDAQAA